MQQICLFLILPWAVLGLEVIAPPSQQTLLGSTLLLPCTFRVENSQVISKFLAILWYFGDTEILRYDNKGKEIIHSRVTVDEKGFLQGNASITLSNVTISDEGTYRCLVIHSPSKQEKKISLKVQAVPGVHIIKKALIKQKEGSLQCLVTDYYPQAIKVTWLLNGNALTRSTSGSPRQNVDGTFRVNSSVTLLPSEIQDNMVIGCQVQHESYPRPLIDSFKVVYGVPPSVQMFSSKVEGHSETIFVCEASGFSPEPVQIKWLLNGMKVEEPRTSEGGGFIKRSYYWNPSGPGNQLANITCEAYHETLYQPVTETLQITKSYRHYYWTGVAILFILLVLLCSVISTSHQNFQVSHIHKLMLDDSEKVTLFCTASDCSKQPQVTWTVMEASETKSKGKRKVIWTENWQDKGSVPASLTQSGESDPLLNEEYTVRTDRLEVGRLLSVLSTLSFKPAVQKHKNIEVSCQFVCGWKKIEKKLKYSYILREPQVSQPIKLSINEAGDVLCSLVLQEFYPRQIRIRWSCGVGCYQDLESNTKINPCSSIQAFNAESECKIPGQLLKDPGFRMRMTWEHESMTGLEQQELSVQDKDFPWRPQMGEIINPDTLIPGTEGKFQCKIWGYFPDALEVKWLRREAGGQELFSVSPSEKYKIPEMEQKREADGTFSCTVSLIVSVSAITEKGAKFICRVGHPSLGEPLETSTGDFSLRRIPVIRSITHSNDKVTAEIDQFYPQDIELVWSRTKHRKTNKYVEYEASRISTESNSNSDGTYRIISSCDPKIYTFTHKHMKLRVEHEALETPIERTLIVKKELSSVKFFELQDGREIPLAESQQSNKKTQ
ncbi:uncharacterized protein LOC108704224 [Xenopus laevis]|uniref:Uncharacterized protein LOC108704224 n=1 Tax=Xenopus laevis TaxID=8355 RepID=A0A8J1LZR7_XENLA|nr:uncharacterized protein LOC108704224 [Xenopus laevis]XP_041434556.1 uncharacterized protein LOC108704224 [Xenopus laevis]